MTTNTLKTKQATPPSRPASRPYNFRLQPAPANADFVVEGQMHLTAKDAYCADRATD